MRLYLATNFSHWVPFPEPGPPASSLSPSIPSPPSRHPNFTILAVPSQFHHHHLSFNWRKKEGDGGTADEEDGRLGGLEGGEVQLLAFNGRLQCTSSFRSQNRDYEIQKDEKRTMAAGKVALMKEL